MINRSGDERYAIPFFRDYQIWFQRQNYDHVRERDSVAVQTD